MLKFNPYDTHFLSDIYTCISFWDTRGRTIWFNFLLIQAIDLLSKFIRGTPEGAINMVTISGLRKLTSS